MFTLGYAFRPWTGGQVHHRRTVHPGIRPRDRARVRHRSQDPLQSPRQARIVVVAGGAVDRGGRARSGQRARPSHLQLPDHVQRLLQLCRGLHPGSPGHRPFQGPCRPPSELDRGRRLRQQARGRDRQRRNRRHARAGAGESRRATSRCCSARRPMSWHGPTRIASPMLCAAGCLRGRPAASRAGRTCWPACTSIGSASAIPSGPRP